MTVVAPLGNGLFQVVGASGSEATIRTTSEPTQWASRFSRPMSWTAGEKWAVGLAVAAASVAAVAGVVELRKKPAAAPGGGGAQPSAVTLVPGSQAITAFVGGTLTISLPQGASWAGERPGARGPEHHRQPQ